MRSLEATRIAQAAKAAAKAGAASGSAAAEAAADGGGYLQRLIAKIVDNIEVSVSHIHVRYEQAHPTTG